LWLLSVGGMAEDTLPVSTLSALTDADSPSAHGKRASSAVKTKELR
jgi:hypothetical protein